MNRFDTIVLYGIGVLLLYSVVLLTGTFIRGEAIGDWIWNRHQNQFSWYSRPLFLIPACYYAYRRKIWHVVGFMALLATSLFWFPAPEQVSDSISDYLEWEKQLFFTNESRLPLIILIVVVSVFLFSLFFTFWKRSPFYGLVLINLGTILKIIVSLGFGKEVGTVSIIPSLSSIAVINVVYFLVRKYLQSKTEPETGS